MAAEDKDGEQSSCPFDLARSLDACADGLSSAPQLNTSSSLVAGQQLKELIHEDQRVPTLSVNRENGHLKSQGQPLYVMEEGQDLPEAAEKNYLTRQNDPTDTLRLPATEQGAQESTRAATEPCLEAQREDAVMVESEEEHIQQVRDDLMAVAEECLKGFEQERTSMPKPDYIDQEPGRFSEIAKEDSEGSNVDAASPKLQHTEQKEQKEPGLSQTTREDHREVKQVVKTALVIHSTTYKGHTAISPGQVPIEQHGAIALSTGDLQSQCALGTSAEPPSHFIPPVQRIEWWIEFVKHNHSKLSHNSSGLFMSSILNPEDVCLILRRFLPSQTSLADSWLNDDIVMSMIRLLFLTSSNVDIIDSRTIEVAFTGSNLTLLRYDPDAELILLPCHYKDHWCLIVVETLLPALTVYNTPKQLNLRTQFVYNWFSKALSGLQLKFEEVRIQY